MKPLELERPKEGPLEEVSKLAARGANWETAGARRGAVVCARGPQLRAMGRLFRLLRQREEGESICRDKNN